jgi:hypothetical protein
LGHRAPPRDILHAHRHRGGREVDRVGQTEDARVVHRKEVALVAHVAALPEVVDDLNGLLEHQVTDVRGRPAFADNVLIEVLASTEAERESIIA